MIAPGSSVRGLSEVDDRQIGALGGDAAHDRPLAAVAVAAAAEHDDQPPARERPERRERALERVRRVGVVAEHDAGRVRDPLHPAGHLGRGGEPLDDVVERRARAPARTAAAASALATLKSPSSGSDASAVPKRAVEREAAARRVEHDARGADVGRRVEAEGDPW